MMKQVWLGILVLLGVLAPVYTGTASAANTPIAVMYSSFSTSSAPIWIAYERGFYEKYGLKAQLVYGTGRLPTQALVAGDVQFISTAATASIPAAVSGGDLVILAGTSNATPLEIFSKPEITKPEQLRNKRIGITSFGSSTDTAIRFALVKWGLKVSDVTLLQLGGCGEILAALRGGGVDAGVCSDPTTIAARKAGFYRLAKLKDLGLNVQHAAIVARRSYTQANPNLTERFLRAFGEAIRYFHTNREGTVEVLAEYLRRMDRETIAESYENYLSIIPKIPYPTVEGIQFILDGLGERDPRARKFNPKDLIDTSFIEKLGREGFFKTQR